MRELFVVEILTATSDTAALELRTLNEVLGHPWSYTKVRATAPYFSTFPQWEIYLADHFRQPLSGGKAGCLYNRVSRTG